MSKEVNCPFCGAIVQEDEKKCPSCGSLFADPELVGLKFKEFGTFVALLVLTFGLFGVFWVIINAKAINNLVVNQKDKIKLNSLIAISFLDVGAYIFSLAKYQVSSFVFPILTILQCLIFIALTYRVLRIIQKYTLKTYNVNIEFNPYYILIFNMLYLVHFVDTYSNRVLQIHEHFNIKSPQMIVLIIILLIIQFVICWDSKVHQFYSWLFGF